MPFVTAQQIAQQSGCPFFQGIIREFVSELKIFNSFHVEELVGTRYRALASKRQENKSSFLNINEGYTATTPVYTVGEFGASRIGSAIEVAESGMKLLERNQDPSLDVDFFTDSAMQRLYDDLELIESQIIYGTAKDAKGFQGMKQLTPATSAADVLALGDANEDYAYAKTVLNAGGTTASTASSVYAVKFGRNDAKLMLGGENGVAGFLNMPQPTRVWKTDIDPVDSKSKSQWWWVTSAEGYAGLCLAGSNEVNRPYRQNCVRRLFNLTNDSGKGLTETKLDYLIESMPVMPDVLYMSNRSREQLRDSKGNASLFIPGGNAPSVILRAPVPTEHRGIPIIATDRIKNTDAIEVPA